LAYIGWLSHPALDLLNTYGIRLLMPLSDQWFYGDTLFIIDIWLWLALGLGVFWSRRRQKQAQPNAYQPARISLALSMAYIGAMGASSVIAEDMTRATADAAGRGPVMEVVASPVPLNPFRRDVVFVANDSYGLGVVTWLPTPQVTLEKMAVPTQMDNPLVAKARASKEVADFLYWARLPYARFEQTPQGQRVVLTDARYSIGAVRNPFLISVTLPDDMAAHQGKGPPQRP
jgi:inner membrane protein